MKDRGLIADATARLSAFEDDHFGDCARVGGKIENGHGAKYNTKPEKVLRQHAALTRAVDTAKAVKAAEEDAGKAAIAVAAARATHAAAEKTATALLDAAA